MQRLWLLLIAGVLTGALEYPLSDRVTLGSGIGSDGKANYFSAFQSNYTGNITKNVTINETSTMDQSVTNYRQVAKYLKSCAKASFEGWSPSAQINFALETLSKTGVPPPFETRYVKTQRQVDSYNGYVTKFPPLSHEARIMLEINGPANFSNVYGDYFVSGQAIGHRLLLVYSTKVFTPAAKEEIADLLKTTYSNHEQYPVEIDYMVDIKDYSSNIESVTGLGSDPRKAQEKAKMFFDYLGEPQPLYNVVQSYTVHPEFQASLNVFQANKLQNCTVTNATNATDANATCDETSWQSKAAQAHHLDQLSSMKAPDAFYDCFVTLEAIDAALAGENSLSATEKEKFQKRIYNMMDDLKANQNDLKKMAGACGAAEDLDKEFVMSIAPDQAPQDKIADVEVEVEVELEESCQFSNATIPYLLEEAKWFKDLPAKIDKTDNDDFRSGIQEQVKLYLKKYGKYQFGPAPEDFDMETNGEFSPWFKVSYKLNGLGNTFQAGELDRLGRMHGRNIEISHSKGEIYFGWYKDDKKHGQGSEITRSSFQKGNYKNGQNYEAE